MLRAPVVACRTFQGFCNTVTMALARLNLVTGKRDPLIALDPIDNSVEGVTLLRKIIALVVQKQRIIISLGVKVASSFPVDSEFR